MGRRTQPEALAAQIQKVYIHGTEKFSYARRRVGPRGPALFYYLVTPGFITS
jgi:hypothetical protein